MLPLVVLHVFVAVLWPVFFIFLQLLVQLGVDFGDIWMPGGVWDNFLVHFGCLGRPWGDLGRPVSIFDRFRVSLGGPSGKLLGPFWHIIFKMDPFEMIVGDFFADSKKGAKMDLPKGG